jgi:hypothetical protein
MALIKHVPGARVKLAGRYALVTEDGEALCFAVRRNAGETLPLVSVPAEFKAVWFVLMDSTELKAA